MLGNNYKIS